MPQSRTRHKHHTHATTPHSQVKPKRSAAVVLGVIAAILGLAVAYFTQGADAMWMLVGAVAGAIVGYLFGRSMDKAIEKP